MFIVKTKTGEETKPKQKHYKRHTEAPCQCSVYSDILTQTAEELQGILYKKI